MQKKLTLESGQEQQGGFDALKLLTVKHQTKNTKLIENTKGKKSLAGEKAIHKRRTEYCTKLYSYKLQTDTNILRKKTKKR